MLIAVTPRFEIWRFFAHNSLRNYTYVLLEKAKGEALVIDPWEGGPLLRWAAQRSWRLTHLINTHGHHDHVRGNEELLAHGVELVSEHAELQRLRLPGHTMDHVGYWLGDGGASHFFAGDTLFWGGVGNCKHGGDVGELYRTIGRLCEFLRPDTHIHPGHDYREKNGQFARLLGLDVLSGPSPFHELPATSWQEECGHNPFLRLGDEGLRRRLCELKPHLAEAPLSDEIVFRELRAMRDQF